jgi:hypothetical protein
MKTLHISIILAVVTTGIILVITMVVLQEHHPEILSTKFPSSSQNYTIDYYANLPSQITTKSFQIKTIPIQIYAPKDKSLHLKLGVTVPNNDHNFIERGDGKIPFGVWAMLNTNDIYLQATSEKGTAIRDTVQLTVFTYSLTSGIYKLSVLLYEDDREANSRIITIVVD